MKNITTKIVISLVSAAVVLAILVPAQTVTAQDKRKHIKKNNMAHRKTVHAKHVPHKRYAHHPKRGTVVKTLNTGSVSITFKGHRMHYHNGIFYKTNGPKYIVTRAPHGIRIKVLPLGYKRFILDKRTCFYYYGTFYQKVDGADEFEVIQAPAGAVVDAIPEGYETVVIDGIEYYTLDDVKYKTKELNNGEIAYEVVGSAK
jgi:hypothetical protein